MMTSKEMAEIAKGVDKTVRAYGIECLKQDNTIPDNAVTIAWARLVKAVPMYRVRHLRDWLVYCASVEGRSPSGIAKEFHITADQVWAIIHRAPFELVKTAVYLC